MRNWINIITESSEIELAEWWHSGRGRNSWTIFQTKSGTLSVYVRRNVLDNSVMEIASVSTLDGFGGARALYREFTADIPAIAENILNPDLDQLLHRWGWTQVYYDMGGTPSRVNPEFMRRFPQYAEARSALHAIMLSRS